jgi:hypothetical protein
MIILHFLKIRKYAISFPQLLFCENRGVMRPRLCDHNSNFWAQLFQFANSSTLLSRQSVNLKYLGQKNDLLVSFPRFICKSLKLSLFIELSDCHHQAVCKSIICLTFRLFNLFSFFVLHFFPKVRIFYQIYFPLFYIFCFIFKSFYMDIILV